MNQGLIDFLAAQATPTWSGQEGQLDVAGENLPPPHARNNTIVQDSVQEEGEVFDKYITRIRVKVNKCSFPADAKDRLIRDKVIHGLKSSTVQSGKKC
ncbi:hypothetical protein DMENIID0001_141590 [Sergentomyia squamirostris]